MPDQTWTTPRDEFAYWHALYDFTVDAAADRHNHLLPRYWTVEDSGLEHSWVGERVFFNPPYAANELHKWVEKASKRQADLAFGLLPSNTDTAWFHDYILFKTGVSIVFRRGRIAFGDPTGEGRGSPRYANLIVIWHKEDKPFEITRSVGL